ncbi:hypothetical protein VTJ04DRAFT_2275 [Mycothermus thermophilus]|uniref:uncharacterized protein n=1 Tax=Humicola insolens TaxID=85995 RepID=UPI0037427382
MRKFTPYSHTALSPSFRLRVHRPELIGFFFSQELPSAPSISRHVSLSTTPPFLLFLLVRSSPDSFVFISCPLAIHPNALLVPCNLCFCLIDFSTLVNLLVL